jgi:uncharacterized cofD-like protein
LGRVLSALNDLDAHITGIVATTDNGGSTGRIRDCQGGIAWGDTRNCINQLIAEPSIASMMFEYRFQGQGELDGHNLGNLMLTALDNLSVRPLDAINLIRDMLQVNVNIIPMSEHPADLCAAFASGKTITGETSIDELDEDILSLDIFPHVPATREAVDAITHADIIIFGPGSFLTSILPPLLLSEIGHSIAANKEAKVLFIENLAPESGPAGRMSLEEKLIWCEKLCGSRSIDLIIGPKPIEKFASRWSYACEALSSPKLTWRHDRNKLKHVLMRHCQLEENH